MIERVFAAIALAVCAVPLWIPYILMAGGMTLLGVRRFGLWVWHWRDARRATESARQAADEAIKRARDRGEWDGNVYTPKSFRKPPHDKMH